MIIKGVNCYGNMSDTATVMMSCTWDKSDHDFDQMYSGSQGFTTWKQLVDYTLIASDDDGYTVHEMESDE